MGGRAAHRGVCAAVVDSAAVRSFCFNPAKNSDVFGGSGSGNSNISSVGSSDGSGMLKRFQTLARSDAAIRAFQNSKNAFSLQQRSIFSSTAVRSNAATAAAPTEGDENTTANNNGKELPKPRDPLFQSPTNQKIAVWLYICALMVGTIIVVGGITRLTESGLSIVDWRPVTGTVPPLTEEDWEKEFAKYKNFPEYKQKPDMTLEDFKQIFFWEWFHRFLARSVGMAYAMPLIYFAARGRFAKSPALKRTLGGLLLLFAAQGGMGWFMVKSGLKKELLDERRKAAVSAYRLAAHLTLALILFTSFIRIGVGLRHFAIAFDGHKQLQAAARVLFVLTFCTAFSGAFVAGLRGGYLYNEGFPLMGGRVFPPMEELFLDDLPAWKNFFENPVMAQTWHRVMAGITTTATIGMNLVARRYCYVVKGSNTLIKTALPKEVRNAIWAVNAAVLLQITLGMLTIITRMHMHMAATHQTGAVFLLAMVVRLCAIIGTRGIVL